MKQATKIKKEIERLKVLLEVGKSKDTTKRSIQKTNKSLRLRIKSLEKDLEEVGEK